MRKLRENQKDSFCSHTILRDSFVKKRTLHDIRKFLIVLFLFSCMSLSADQMDDDVLALRRFLSLYEQGEFRLVQEQGSVFLHKFPQSQNQCYVLMVLGDVAAQQNNEQLARSYYEKLNGTSLELQGERKIWEFLARQEQWEELKIRVIRKKNLPEEYLFIAAALLVKNNPDVSAYLYRRVMEGKGEHAFEASMAYIQLQISLGQSAQGYQVLKEMVKINPEMLTVENSLSQPLLITLISLAHTLHESKDIPIWVEKYKEMFGTESVPYQFDLLLAQEALNTNKDISIYLKHLEQAWKKYPDLSKDENFHHQTFKGYYQLGKYPEAALHLKKVYEYHPQKMTAEEKLWLAENIDNDPRLADQSAHLMTEALSADTSGWIFEFNEKNLGKEKKVLKLARALMAQGKNEEGEKILLHLTKFQLEHGEWTWSTKDEALSLLIETYMAQGKCAEVKDMLSSYCKIDAEIKSPLIEKGILVYFRRLDVDKKPILEKNKSITESYNEDPLMSYLQQVVHCRVFDHEPNHLEAALDLVHYRYHGNPIGQCSALLSFKEWFLFKDDIPSRDYHAAKESKQGGVQLFEGYMLLFDGELARLDAEIAFEQGRESMGRKKKEVAVKIYKNILNGSYGVTPYLLQKAKEGIMLLEPQEP